MLSRIKSRLNIGGRGAEVAPSPFIVGVGRSGTTLLRLMLDAHPELTIPPETHFIPKVANVCAGATASDPRRSFCEVLTSSVTWNYFGLDEETLERRVANVEPFDTGEALRTFYQLYAERFGKPRWGDKTPLYVRKMKLIQGLLPEARFIHVIRDGRDVALSNVPLWFGPNSVEEAAHWWQDWIHEAREQARHLDSYMEVRYEDLVTDTVPTLKRVCKFIDLAWDPIMLSYHRTAKERIDELAHDVMDADGKVIVRGDERTKIHSFTSKPPQKSRIARWKTQMPAEDRQRFEEIAGGTLRDLGYETG